MKKQQIATTTVQLLLPFLLAGCAVSFATQVAPTPDLSQNSIPTHQPPHLTPTAAAMPTWELPGVDSVLNTWNFSEEDLLIDSAYITKYGKHLVVTFTDARLMVYNFETGKAQVFRPPVDFPFEDGVSSRSTGILVADYMPGESGNVTLWQISNEEESHVVANITESDYFLTALAISPDGEILALGYTGTRV